MPDHISELTLDAVRRALGDVVHALERTLPRAVTDRIATLPQAGSDAEFDRILNDIILVTIDHSRAGDTFSGISANHCTCILCGERVGTRRGIEHHVRGRDCRVLRAILLLARATHADNAARRKDREARQAAELAAGGTLYLVDLGVGPEARPGTGTFFQRREMGFAEDRLAALGFTRRADPGSAGGTLIRWEKITETAYVLANPLGRGQIDFRAWPRRILTTAWDLRAPRARQSPEKINDRWHKDLEGKLALRIERLLASFDPAPA